MQALDTITKTNILNSDLEHLDNQLIYWKTFLLQTKSVKVLHVLQYILSDESLWLILNGKSRNRL